jgi:mono/diheme cytochrome c family protein
MSRDLKRFLYGGMTALVGALLIAMLAGLLILKLGLVPINADEAPSNLEKKLFTFAVRASVARHSSEQAGIGTSTDDHHLETGAEIYKTMCAQCHGQLNGRASLLGRSFYPPAPQLPGHSTTYTEPELFWIVKHGIRNTSMPAWRNLLSDDDIRQVVVLLKRLDSLPPEVDAKSNRNGLMSDQTKDD